MSSQKSFNSSQDLLLCVIALHAMELSDLFWLIYGAYLSFKVLEQ